jgi:hypothetical protein
MVDINDIDHILHKLNTLAWEHESKTIKSLGKSISSEMLVRLFNSEANRLGGQISIDLLNYIKAVIWCYANTPVNEGDVIQIDIKIHTPKGEELIARNENLVGQYLLPLYLYGAEYFVQMRKLMPKGSINFEDYTDFSAEQVAYTYESFASALIEVALQARYYHINQCYIREYMDDEEFFERDFSGERFPEGRIITADEID